MRYETVLMKTTIRLAWVMVAVFAAACGGALVVEWENGGEPPPARTSSPAVILPG